MANLTAKELSAIEDQLNCEQMLIRKFRAYAQSATDPQIKASCENMAQRHKRHYDTLMGHLN